MELKLQKIVFVGGGKERSNRTFMELKLMSPVQRNMAVLCSNRTFMELKQAKKLETKEDIAF